MALTAAEVLYDVERHRHVIFKDGFPFVQAYFPFAWMHTNGPAESW